MWSLILLEKLRGCVEKDEASIEQMKAQLKDEDLIFSNDQFENLGRLHTDNKKYPKGILLVIDRLAVSKMKESVKIVKNTLSEKAKKSRKDSLHHLVRYLKKVWRRILK